MPASYPYAPRTKSHAETKVYKESADGDLESPERICCSYATSRERNDGAHGSPLILKSGDSMRLFNPLRANPSQFRHIVRHVVWRAGTRVNELLD